MTTSEYKDALATQLMAASTEQAILAIQKVTEGEAAWTLAINQDCSLVIGPPDKLNLVMVICGMTPEASATGLVIATCAIDALTLGNRDWRNGILNRLHLFDGKAANGLRHATQARGWEFAVQVNHPGKGLMSYTIQKL